RGAASREARRLGWGRIVLAVVADEDPAQLGQVAEEAAQSPALVCLTGAEPALGGRSPVGHQQRPARVAVPDQEAGDRPGDVPGAGGEVDDERVGLCGAEPVV